MARFRSQFRHLYLLALFQLVGGPLVILPLVMVCKVTLTQTAQHGVVEGLRQAPLTKEWQRASVVLLHGEAALPDSHEKNGVPGTPEKFKEGKVKLDLAVWMTAAIPQPESAAIGRPCWRWLPSASTWAHAPPGPPPRVG